MRRCGRLNEKVSWIRLRGRNWPYHHSLPDIKPLEFTRELFPVCVRRVRQQRVDQQHTVQNDKRPSSALNRKDNAPIQHHPTIRTAQPLHDSLHKSLLPPHLLKHHIEPIPIHAPRRRLRRSPTAARNGLTPAAPCTRGDNTRVRLDELLEDGGRGTANVDKRGR